MRLLLHFAFVGWVKLHYRNTYQVIKVIKEIQNNLPVGLDPGVSPICKNIGSRSYLGILFSWSQIQVERIIFLCHSTPTKTSGNFAA